MDEEQPCCRICHGPASEAEPLYHPCSCKGSVSALHNACLENWLAVRRKHAAPRNAMNDFGGEDDGDDVPLLSDIFADDESCEVCGAKLRFRNMYAPGAPAVVGWIPTFVGLAKHVGRWMLGLLRTKLLAAVSTMQMIAISLSVSFLFSLCAHHARYAWYQLVPYRDDDFFNSRRLFFSQSSSPLAFVRDHARAPVISYSADSFVLPVACFADAFVFTDQGLVDKLVLSVSLHSLLYLPYLVGELVLFIYETASALYSPSLFEAVSSRATCRNHNAPSLLFHLEKPSPSLIFSRRCPLDLSAPALAPVLEGFMLRHTYECGVLLIFLVAMFTCLGTFARSISAQPKIVLLAGILHNAVTMMAQTLSHLVSPLVLGTFTLFLAQDWTDVKEPLTLGECFATASRGVSATFQAWLLGFLIRLLLPALESPIRNALSGGFRQRLSWLRAHGGTLGRTGEGSDPLSHRRAEIEAAPNALAAMLVATQHAGRTSLEFVRETLAFMVHLFLVMEVARTVFFFCLLPLLPVSFNPRFHLDRKVVFSFFIPSPRRTNVTFSADAGVEDAVNTENANKTMGIFWTMGPTWRELLEPKSIPVEPEMMDDLPQPPDRRSDLIASFIAFLARWWSYVSMQNLRTTSSSSSSAPVARIYQTFTLDWNEYGVMVVTAVLQITAADVIKDLCSRVPRAWRRVCEGIYAIPLAAWARLTSTSSLVLKAPPARVKPVGCEVSQEGNLIVLPSRRGDLMRCGSRKHHGEEVVARASPTLEELTRWLRESGGEELTVEYISGTAIAFYPSFDPIKGGKCFVLVNDADDSCVDVYASPAFTCAAMSAFPDRFREVVCSARESEKPHIVLSNVRLVRDKDWGAALVLAALPSSLGTVSRNKPARHSTKSSPKRTASRNKEERKKNNKKKERRRRVLAPRRSVVSLMSTPTTTTSQTTEESRIVREEKREFTYYRGELGDDAVDWLRVFLFSAGVGIVYPVVWTILLVLAPLAVGRFAHLVSSGWISASWFPPHVSDTHKYVSGVFLLVYGGECACVVWEAVREAARGAPHGPYSLGAIVRVLNVAILVVLLDFYTPVMSAMLLELTVAPTTTISVFATSTPKGAVIGELRYATVRLDLSLLWLVGTSPQVLMLVFALTLPPSLWQTVTRRPTYWRRGAVRSAAEGMIRSLAIPLCTYLTLAVFAPMAVGAMVDAMPTMCLHVGAKACQGCEEMPIGGMEFIFARACESRLSREGMGWLVWERFGSERIHATLTMLYLAYRVVCWFVRIVQRARERERDRRYLLGRVVVNRGELTGEEGVVQSLGGH